MSSGKNRSEPKSWNGKPYNFFGDYLHERFGVRILKLPLDAHLGCPNRDGSLDTTGCIFCAPDGSASPVVNPENDIIAQMMAAQDSFRRGNVPTRYIAYFQAFTNTYAPLQKLKELYDSALSFEGIAGIMIGTRPDCLPDEVIDLIASYKRDDFELWLEIGMQTMHEKSLKFLNRHHSYEHTLDAVRRTSKRGIDICLHLILGVPGETWDDMMRTAEEVSMLPIAGVKLHHLHVIRNTPLARMHERKEIHLMSFQEYVSTTCDFIERLRGDILIHRLSGDRDRESLVAPAWGLHKGTVIKAIEDEFARRGTHQGFLCLC